VKTKSRRHYYCRWSKGS